MKKKWISKTNLLIFLASSMISLSVNATTECTAFHGNWSGTCSNEDYLELNIIQESCDSIEYKGKLFGEVSQRKLPLGKGHVGSTKTIAEKTIDRKLMASRTPTGNGTGQKLTIQTMETVTKSPNLFYVDIARIGLTLRRYNEMWLTYEALGKKVETQETKIVHTDYSLSCHLVYRPIRE